MGRSAFCHYHCVRKKKRERGISLLFWFRVAEAHNPRNQDSRVESRGDRINLLIIIIRRRATLASGPTARTPSGYVCPRDLSPASGSPRSYLPWVSHEHASRQQLSMSNKAPLNCAAGIAIRERKFFPTWRYVCQRETSRKRERASEPEGATSPTRPGSGKWEMPLR